MKFSLARLQHLIEYAFQLVVLESSRNSFLVGKLLVDLIVLAMGPLLDPHINPVIWRQGLFETNPHT